MVVLGTWPCMAQAQEPPSSGTAGLDTICPESTRERPTPSADRQQGRPEFVLGLADVEDERWGDAVVHFGESYERSGSPVALYNLALALRALGFHLQARDAFCTLAQNPSLPDPALAEETEALARTEAERVSTLLVTPGRPERGMQLTFEDQVLELTAPLQLELDAERTYSLLFEADGYEQRLLTLTLAIAEQRAETILLDPVPPAGGGVDETVLWTTLLIIGVAAIAGGAIGGYFAYEGAQLGPTHPNSVRLP